MLLRERDQLLHVARGERRMNDKDPRPVGDQRDRREVAHRVVGSFFWMLAVTVNVLATVVKVYPWGLAFAATSGRLHDAL